MEPTGRPDQLQYSECINSASDNVLAYCELRRGMIASVIRAIARQTRTVDMFHSCAHREDADTFMGKKLVARPEGFEPPTAWFVARYSIQLSYGRAVQQLCVLEHASSSENSVGGRETTGWGPDTIMAEREGFEPSMELLTPYSLSRGAPSATRPSLQIGVPQNPRRRFTSDPRKTEHISWGNNVKYKKETASRRFRTTSTTGQHLC